MCGLDELLQRSLGDFRVLWLYPARLASMTLGIRGLEVVMRARPGDQLVIRGHRVGDHEKSAEILEVRGTREDLSYLVKWAADGHEAVIYPGSDAVVKRPTKKTLAKT